MLSHDPTNHMCHCRTRFGKHFEAGCAVCPTDFRRTRDEPRSDDGTPVEREPTSNGGLRTGLSFDVQVCWKHFALGHTPTLGGVDLSSSESLHRPHSSLSCHGSVVPLLDTEAAEEISAAKKRGSHGERVKFADLRAIALVGRYAG